MRKNRIIRKGIALMMAAFLAASPGANVTANAAGDVERYFDVGAGEDYQIEISENLFPEGTSDLSDGEYAPDSEGTLPELPVFPAIEGYVLDAEQQENREALKNHIPEIAGLVEGKDYVERELIFTADSEQEALLTAEAYGAELESFSYSLAVIKLPENVRVIDAVRAAVSSEYSGDKVLPPAWPNYYRYASVVELDDYKTEPMLRMSSDTYQWQHEAVGSYYAWDKGYTGAGVTVAILDTGTAQNHVEFPSGKIKEWFEADAELEDSSNDQYDHNGHGTNVAGIVGAALNSEGGAGIAPDADLMSVKVLGDNGSGSDAGIMRGINFAVAQGADIINMSLGGMGYNGIYDTVIGQAYEKGVAVFVAAGNESSRSKTHPADVDKSIAIGAVMNDMTRTYFSNYGPWVKFSAPGYNIWSATIPENEDSVVINGSLYDYMSGTSQATPVVAGTAAVIMSATGIKDMPKDGRRVDALIEKMKSGTIQGKGGAAPIVYLPAVLGISTGDKKSLGKAPGMPEFSVKTGTITDADNVSLKIAADEGVSVYYSVDGKDITYKNGSLSDNAIFYNGGTLELSPVGKNKKLTLKAVAMRGNTISKNTKEIYTFNVGIKDIMISGPNVVNVNGTIKLNADIAPTFATSTSIDWISSAPSVAQVSGGKVKGISAGTASITAKAKNGTVISNPIEVTVVDSANSKIKSISFVNASGKAMGNLYCGIDEEQDITGYLKIVNKDGSEGSADDIIFGITNDDVAELVSGKTGVFRGKTAGSFVLTASAVDGKGPIASLNVMVNDENSIFIADAEDSKLEFDFIAKGKSKQYKAGGVGAGSSEGLVWSVSDISGKPVQGFSFDDKKNMLKCSSSVPAGSYFLNMEAGSVKKQIPLTIIEKPISKIVPTVYGDEVKQVTIFRTEGSSNSPTETEITPKLLSTGNIPDGCFTFSYTDNNSGVATVERSHDGASVVVKASGDKTGTVKITFVAGDGSGRKTSVNVLVKNPVSRIDIVPPEGVTVLGIGNKIKLTPAMESAYGDVSDVKVKWFIEDGPQYATITQNGELSVKKTVRGDPSSVTVRAVTMDGSNAEGYYTIRVWQKIKSITVPSLGKNVLELKEDLYYYYTVLYNGKKWTENGTYPELRVIVDDEDVCQARVHIDENRNSRLEIFVGEKVAVDTTGRVYKTKITLQALDGGKAKKTYTVSIKKKNG